MTLSQLPVIFHPSTEKLTGPNYTREDKRVETSVETKTDKCTMFENCLKSLILPTFASEASYVYKYKQMLSQRNR